MDTADKFSDNLERKANVTLSRKMILWIFIITISMMFAAWTSAYIFKRSEGNWFEFSLPNMMLYSTIVLIVSSVSMHMAYKYALQDNLERLKIALIFTTLLGVSFVFMQFQSFKALIDNQIYFTGKNSNVSASFLYILTFIHALHIVAGIVFLLITLVKSLRNNIHSKNMLTLEMCATFWHFLDGLWLYLYVFLYFNR